MHFIEIAMVCVAISGVLSATPKAAEKTPVEQSDPPIVLRQVTIVNAEITVADRDTSGTGAVTALQYPTTISRPLDADSQQRVVVKFQLKDKLKGDVMSAHQTFVQMKNVNKARDCIHCRTRFSTELQIGSQFANKS